VICGLFIGDLATRCKTSGCLRCQRYETDAVYRAAWDRMPAAKVVTLPVAENRAAQAQHKRNPGVHLVQLAGIAGLPVVGGCCGDERRPLQDLMRSLGVAGCWKEFSRLVGYLEKHSQSVPRWLKAAVANALQAGFTLSPDAPAESLIREAIRRADEEGRPPLEERARQHMTPGWMAKVATFLAAKVEHAISGKEASAEEKSRRLSICQVCPFFDAEKTVCNNCGCWLEIKAAWLEKHCPIDKW
jgi:hypothetical protein